MQASHTQKASDIGNSHSPQTNVVIDPNNTFLNNNDCVFITENNEAFSDCICPTFFLNSIIMGTLPIISITAKRIIPTVKISFRLIINFFFKYNLYSNYLNNYFLIFIKCLGLVKL